MIRLCFYRRSSYPIFDGRAPGTFGGADVRAVLLARELAKRPGFRVCFVVGDSGQPERQHFDGVEVVVDRPSFPRYHRAVRHAYYEFRKTEVIASSPPWLRPRGFRWGLLWQVPLLAFHAGPHLLAARFRQPRVRRVLTEGHDAVCCFGATTEAADVVASCQRSGARSVVFVTGDSQLYCRHPKSFPEMIDYSPRDAELMDYALTHADHIVVQTVDQQQLLHKEFNRSSVVVRNPVEIRPTPKTGTPRYVLWIGRADLVHKRSDRLVELAKRCPDVPFHAIVGPWQPGILERTKRTAPPNLTILERAPPAEISSLLRDAAVLVNTSASEGFPNAFLQAAMMAVPVVSLKVDPDGFCQSHGCGIACRDDMEQMAREVLALWRDAASRELIGRRGREFVLREHSLATSVTQLAALFEQLYGERE